METETIKRPAFIDAQQMARNNPTTFFCPSFEQIDEEIAKCGRCDDSTETLKEPLLVKVCFGNEKFWVKLTRVVGDELIGTVDNDLIHSNKHGLKNKDEVSFKKEHIYDVDQLIF